jgi:hypothetical protein
MADLVAVRTMNSWKIGHLQSRAMVREEVSYVNGPKSTELAAGSNPVATGTSRKSLAHRRDQCRSGPSATGWRFSKPPPCESAALAKQVQSDVYQLTIEVAGRNLGTVVSARLSGQ